uniref:Uncharacterized protein n=1 Tax=Glossina austeni TaxID=7395 RepID=A0A1A9VNI8_GLOAU
MFSINRGHGTLYHLPLINLFRLQVWDTFIETPKTKNLEWITKMERLCSKLSLTVGTLCTKWILQATEHCLELISEADSFFHHLRTHFLLEGTSTLEHQNVPFSAVPKSLKFNDCIALLENLRMDDIKRDRDYAAQSEENEMLVRVINSLLIAVLLIVCTVILFYSDVPKWMKKAKLSKKALIETKRAVPAIEENVNRRTHLAPHGTPMPVIRMRSKLELFESIFNKNLSVRLHRLPDQQNKPNYDSETQVQLRKGLDFTRGNARKLHLLVLWDDDDGDDDDQVYVEDNRTTSPPPPSFASTPSPTSRKSNSTGARLKSPKSSSKTRTLPSESLVPVGVKRQRRATDNKSLVRSRKTGKINEI